MSSDFRVCERNKKPKGLNEREPEGVECEEKEKLDAPHSCALVSLDQLPKPNKQANEPNKQTNKTKQ